MSRQSDGTDKPVPAMKKPILLEDIEAAQQPHSGDRHGAERLGHESAGPLVAQ